MIAGPGAHNDMDSSELRNKINDCQNKLLFFYFVFLSALFVRMKFIKVTQPRLNPDLE